MIQKLNVEKFEEGQIINFNVVRSITMPDDHEYFVLESIAGNRYLLRKKYYESYNINIGDNINCRIDKVNCSGKIFMEPEHPYYISGNTYEFKVAGRFTEENPGGILNNGVIVEDKLGNRIPVITNGHSVNCEGTIECVVMRIKKGLPVLMPVTYNNPGEYIHNYKCTYRIIETYNTVKNESYYVLDNMQGTVVYLNAKDYEGFGFKAGDEIECITVDMTPSGQPVVEPVNPFYNIGGIYEFKVSRWQDEKDHYGETRETLVVKDVLGKDARVFFPDYEKEYVFKKDDFIRCMVTRYKKGHLMLEAIK